MVCPLGNIYIHEQYGRWQYVLDSRHNSMDFTFLYSGPQQTDKTWGKCQHPEASTCTTSAVGNVLQGQMGTQILLEYFGVYVVYRSIELGVFNCFIGK